jgi:hypothetical protein
LRRVSREASIPVLCRILNTTFDQHQAEFQKSPVDCRDDGSPAAAKRWMTGTLES